MKKLSLILFSLSTLLILPELSISGEKIISGKAQVIDGDTIKINDKKIRFGGIDAPESYFMGKKQTCIEDNKKVFCGQISKDKLIEKIGNNSVNCKIEKNKDYWKRTVAECFINDEGLSSFMVINGYACDYVKYSKKKYAKEQEYAKTNSLSINFYCIPIYDYCSSFSNIFL